MNTQIQLSLFLLAFESLSLKVCMKILPFKFSQFLFARSIYLHLASFNLFSNNLNQFAFFYSQENQTLLALLPPYDIST
jgi:hypothetical protein